MLSIEALKEYGADTETGVAMCCNNPEFYLRMMSLLPKDAHKMDDLRVAFESEEYGTAFEITLVLKQRLSNLALTLLTELIGRLNKISLRLLNLSHGHGTPDEELDYLPLLEIAECEWKRLLEVIKGDDAGGATQRPDDKKLNAALDRLNEYGADAEKGLRRYDYRTDLYFYVVNMLFGKVESLTELRRSLFAGHFYSAFCSLRELKCNADRLGLIPVSEPATELLEMLKPYRHSDQKELPEGVDFKPLLKRIDLERKKLLKIIWELEETAQTPAPQDEEPPDNPIPLAL